MTSPPSYDILDRMAIRELEIMDKEQARIKDGAIIGCDMHQVRWADNGEIFDVLPFTENTRKLVGPHYGGKPYGNGAVYVKVEDLIFK